MLDSSLRGGCIIALQTKRMLCMNMCIEVIDLTKSFNGRVVAVQTLGRVQQ